MINRDVPIAIFISSPANKTKAGIIKNPPPAPTKPVIAPTTTPSNITKIIFVILVIFFLSILGLRSLIIISPETNIKQANIKRIKKLFVIVIPKVNELGIKGKSN